MTSKLKLGVSLFSYSSEYYLGRFSLDDTLRRAKEAGAQGVEIVASQMMPGFPYPTKAWLHSFRARCEQLELEPFCYSAHLDSGLRSDRWLTDEEKVMSTVNDLRSAYEMGASVVRTQHSISPELLYQVAPWAEKYRVKVGVEIHPPHRFETDVWQRFIRAFRDLDSPYIGVVVDTGIYQEYPYDGWLDVYAQHGVRRETIDALLRLLAQDAGMEKARKYLAENDASAYAEELAGELFSLYRPYREDELADVIQYVTHFHTKFYHMENGEEKTVPYARILDVVQRSGYEGYLISEYEGHYCYDADRYPAAEQVRMHIEMERRLLQERSAQNMTENGKGA